MKELTEYVSEKRGKAVTDSLRVAEHFGKAHRHVLRSIDNLVARKRAAENMFKESKFINEQGREYRSFEITRDGFSILVMGFTGEKALDFKFAFIEAFNKMEYFISQRISVEWKQARESGKAQRRELTDALKEFVDYAKAQGSKNAERYYSTISRETYKALSFIEKSEKVTTKIRDLLNSLDLAFLGVCEEVVSKAILDGMEKELDYHDIYQLAKERLLEIGATLTIAKNKRTELLGLKEQK